MPETNPPAEPMIVRLPLIKFQRTNDGRVVGEVVGSTPVPPGMLNGQYLGPNGYTTDITEATDFRGEPGATIVEGETVEVEGPKGDPGADGKSAYQLWLEAGNVGSQAVFLAALKGEQGPEGPRGYTGDPGPRGETGLQGVKGDTGMTGGPGPKGDTGSAGAKGDKGDTGSTGAKGDAGASFSIAAPSVTALSAGEKNGTAFQPRANGPSAVNVTGSLAGLLNVSTAITVSISATQNGTYTPVSLFSLTLNLAGIGISDAATGTFMVPAGWWVKVTQTGVSLLASVSMNRIVWNL